MSCSNGCNAPMSGGSRRVQVGDRRKRNNKSRRVTRGGFWPFSSDNESTSSSLASGLSSPEKKQGWFSSLFGSSDSSSSPAPSYSFNSQSGGRKRSRAHRGRKHKTRRHKRRH
jgi:hypothetical protein